MIVINPNEIGSKISTLIREANTKFIAVSPYIDISDWKKMIVNITQAIERGVTFEVFFREIKDKDYNLLSELGVKLYKIKGLHTKLYFNEKDAVVTSMNLYEYSDLHSIDMALYFSQPEDYNKIFDYFMKYIYNQKLDQIFISQTHLDYITNLEQYLKNRFSDVKITSTTTYVFSKNLVPIFHCMIYNDTIRLKLPLRNPSEEDIKTVHNKINALFDEKIPYEKYNTSDETFYVNWYIENTGKSNLEIVSLLNTLKKLEV